MPYAKISINLKRAIIAAEDAKFVDHEGFDWEGIQKALEKNQKKGRFVAGGSTISQQLAKNLFLTPTKSYFRKAEEAVITLMLENVWSKQRIFEVYLNVITSYSIHYTKLYDVAEDCSRAWRCAVKIAIRRCNG